MLSHAPSLRRLSWLGAVGIAAACSACSALLGSDVAALSNDDDDVQPKRDGGVPRGQDAEPDAIPVEPGGTCPTGLSACSGACVDLSADPLHCGDCATVCDEGATCSGRACSNATSCRELLSRKPGAATGIYSLASGAAQVKTFCDMTTDGGGWTLVYRISAGAPGDPYTIYVGAPMNEEVMAELTPFATKAHYSSRLLSRWNADFAVQTARAHVYGGMGGQAVVRTMVFDAVGSTSGNWFAPARIRQSPWTDVGTAAKFSLDGDGANVRRFLINAAYASCETDSGWFLVRGSSPTAVCPWEAGFDKMRIFYATGTTSQGWNTAHGDGTSFAVFVR
jgi:hypothetical protein